ncbi:uncharacterized protein ACWYII_033949 [Salvelinus alpinus]
MESLDELEHPLLGKESPKADPRGLGTTRLFNGVLMRCEEDKTLPLGWRVYCGGAGEHGPGELGHQQVQQQLLDPCSLPSTLETLYPPAPLWGHPDATGLGNKDYLETTFVDIYPESPLERKLFAESQQDLHSVFYSLEDEDDLLPDYELAKDANSAVLAKDANSDVLAKDANSAVLAKDANSDVLAKDANSAVLAKDANSAVLAKDANSAVLAKDANSDVLAKDANSAVLAKDANSDVLAKDANSAVLAKDANSAVLAKDANSAV